MSDLKHHVQSIIKDLEGSFEGDIFDYLEGVLDINYVINSKGDYQGAIVLVAFGGPNIYIDTHRGYVEGFWYQDYYRESYRDEIGFNDAIEATYQC